MAGCKLPGYSGREVALEVAYACGDVNPLTLAFAPIGALTTKEFSLTWETTDATADDTVGSLRSNMATWQTLEVTYDGICKRADGTKYNQVRLMKHIANPGSDFSGQPVVWARLTFPDLTFIFYALATGQDRSAPFDGNTTFSGTLTATESDFGLIVLDTPNPDAPAATGVTVAPAELDMEIGQKSTLSATVAPPTALQSVVWASSVPEVASVNQSGEVTAWSEGIATVTATSASGLFNGVCDVTVTAP